MLSPLPIYIYLDSTIPRVFASLSPKSPALATVGRIQTLDNPGMAIDRGLWCSGHWLPVITDVIIKLHTTGTCISRVLYSAEQIITWKSAPAPIAQAVSSARRQHQKSFSCADVGGKDTQSVRRFALSGCTSDRSAAGVLPGRLNVISARSVPRPPRDVLRGLEHVVRVATRAQPL